MPDDYGWKQVHGDVFRTPSYPLLFSSIIGTGYHLLSVLFITIGLAILAEFYTELVLNLPLKFYFFLEEVLF